MRINLKTLFLLTFTLFFLSMSTQENINYFIQFKIHTISTIEEAKRIDIELIKKSGISKSRTDYKSSTYYCLLKPGILYSQKEFDKWFEKLGYTISCFNSGIINQDRLKSPYEFSECTENQE